MVNYPLYAMTGRDILAIVVAIGGGFSLFIYLVVSGAFKAKIFRLGPHKEKVPEEMEVEHWYTRLANTWNRMLYGSGWRYAKAKKRARVALRRRYRTMPTMLPKEAKVEHWYTRLANTWNRMLLDGGWLYAKAKKRARVAFKKSYREMQKSSKEKVPGTFRRLNRDIAVGALIITITLVAFLLIKLL